MNRQLFLWKQNDWQRVVDLHPNGHLEIRTHRHIIRGPIESVVIDSRGEVTISLAWAAKAVVALLNYGCGWKTSPNYRYIRFPNGTLPFEIAETARGTVVRFQNKQLFVSEVESLDPTRVKGLRIAS